MNEISADFTMPTVSLDSATSGGKQDIYRRP